MTEKRKEPEKIIPEIVRLLPMSGHNAFVLLIKNVPSIINAGQIIDAPQLLPKISPTVG